MRWAGKLRPDIWCHTLGSPMTDFKCLLTNHAWEWWICVWFNWIIWLLPLLHQISKARNQFREKPNCKMIESRTPQVQESDLRLRTVQPVDLPVTSRQNSLTLRKRKAWYFSSGYTGVIIACSLHKLLAITWKSKGHFSIESNLWSIFAVTFQVMTWPSTNNIS